MIDYIAAKSLAEKYLQFTQLTMGGLQLVLLENETKEESFGWVFFYNSKEYIETGNLSFTLAGNAPFIIDKITGEIYITGTAHPLEYYTANYPKFVNLSKGSL